MKKLIFLLLALPTLLTAQEKPVQVPPCVEGNSYTIKIPVKFPENMTVQYVWYRNDTLIEDTHTLLLGEKVIAYTIPADKAFGSALYHFKYNLHDEHDGEWTDSPRYAVSFYVLPPPLKKGGIIWASTNVDDYQTFAARPDMYTKFYQWNRATAWSATAKTVNGWNNVGDYAAETWTNNPCPDGWRLPTNTEFNDLNNSGGMQARANERGNAVVGCFYGPNHATCTMFSMAGCVFLPAVGYRDNITGELNTQGLTQYYWSATEFNELHGYDLYSYTTNFLPNHYNGKAFGMSIRCVQDVQ